MRVNCLAQEHLTQYPQAMTRRDQTLTASSGPGCSKAINANPGLKVNQVINFSSIKVFFFANVL